MSLGYDIGASSSTSSGVQQGGSTVNAGDFIIGGSGGANKAPTWLVIAGAALLVIGLLAFMLMPRK